ncbi:MAG: DUF6242 domain-containing protein [Prevotellaceae bacterium]|nr:DUF6242 domain-containing protein [Prevotellaceae bacterium]
MLKNKILFPALIAVSLIFSSCLGNNSADLSDDANVISFSLKTGTSETFPTTTFTIDTINLIIYNVDSIKFLTRIDSLVPVIGTNTASSIKINDTITYSTTTLDTLDFSDTVRITVTSQDKKNTKTFKVVLNVHQADPDLYVWDPLEDEIYSENTVQQKLFFFENSLNLFVKTNSGVKLFYSENCDTVWNTKSTTNFPNTFDIKYTVLLDNKLYIAENQQLYTSENGTNWTSETTTGSVNHLLFAMNGQVFGIDNSTLTLKKLNGTIWENVTTLPSKFPVEGAGICVANSTAGNERVYVVGGKDSNGNLLNSVFSSENGSYWANLASKNWFSPREEISVVQYDDVLMLIGGKDTNGVIINDEENKFFIISPDFGISWRAPYDNMSLPLDFVARFALQTAVNDDKTIIYLVGGQTDMEFLKDAWQGMKNSLLWQSLK